MVYRHEAERDVHWNIVWEQAEPLHAGAALNLRDEPSTIGLDAAVGVARDQLKCRHITYEVGNYRYMLRQKDKGFELASDAVDFEFKRIVGRPPTLPGPMKSYAFPDLAKTNFQNADLLAKLEASYEAQMDRIYHLGPLREAPKRQYGWAGSRPTDVGRQGGQVVEAILAARAAGDKLNLKKGGKRLPFEEIVAHWLKELGLIEEFRIEEIGEGSNLYRAWVRLDRHSPEALITDVGFGISQVLPAIVLLNYVPEGSTVILEQPEIHLHPGVQANLADLLIHAAMYRGVQVILESHSEHLLRRLQRRIAEEAVSAEMARLYFCSIDKGHSKLAPLKLNELGHIENWPEKFFGDEFGEIAAIHSAALKRRARSRAAE